MGASPDLRDDPRHEIHPAIARSRRSPGQPLDAVTNRMDNRRGIGGVPGGKGRDGVTYRGALLMAAATIVVAGAAQAGPITLACRHGDNVYAAPYRVSIDAKNAALVIRDDDRVDVYAIESVEDRKGDRQVTASGKLLDSHIIVTLSGRRQVTYTDAFTDRAFAIDYCE